MEDSPGGFSGWLGASLAPSRVGWATPAGSTTGVCTAMRAGLAMLSWPFWAGKMEAKPCPRLHLRPMALFGRRKKAKKRRFGACGACGACGAAGAAGAFFFFLKNTQLLHKKKVDSRNLEFFCFFFFCADSQSWESAGWMVLSSWPRTSTGRHLQLGLARGPSPGGFEVVAVLQDFCRTLIFGFCAGAGSVFVAQG